MKDLLRAAATRNGWSVETAATRVELYTGASGRTVRRWFTGHGTPPVAHIPGLCQALGIDPNELFLWPESGEATIANVEPNIAKRTGELRALAQMGEEVGAGTATATRTRKR